jgi:hypothetical protein
MAKPYEVVYEHVYSGEPDASMMVGMASNNDIHFRLDKPGVAAVSHTLTMEEFDQLVEKVHEWHAEVEDA